MWKQPADIRPPVGPALARDSLVAHSLDSLCSTLIVVFLHVAVHSAKLHLSSEVDVHGTLLHRGVDEFVRRVS